MARGKVSEWPGEKCQNGQGKSVRMAKDEVSEWPGIKCQNAQGKSFRVAWVKVSEYAYVLFRNEIWRVRQLKQRGCEVVLVIVVAVSVPRSTARGQSKK